MQSIVSRVCCETGHRTQTACVCEFEIILAGKTTEKKKLEINQRKKTGKSDTTICALFLPYACISRVKNEIFREACDRSFSMRYQSKKYLITKVFRDILQCKKEKKTN